LRTVGISGDWYNATFIPRRNDIVLNPNALIANLAGGQSGFGLPTIEGRAPSDFALAGRHWLCLVAPIVPPD
jgi:hypothetical protein